jgi:hypothetical protein
MHGLRPRIRPPARPRDPASACRAGERPPSPFRARSERSQRTRTLLMSAVAYGAAIRGAAPIPFRSKGVAVPTARRGTLPINNGATAESPETFDRGHGREGLRRTSTDCRPSTPASSVPEVDPAAALPVQDNRHGRVTWSGDAIRIDIAIRCRSPPTGPSHAPRSEEGCSDDEYRAAIRRGEDVRITR